MKKSVDSGFSAVPVHNQCAEDPRNDAKSGDSEDIQLAACNCK